MFYLTTHSTHFILRLYGVGHMVKDDSDSEGGNPLPPHGLFFRLTARVLLYAPSHRRAARHSSVVDRPTARGAVVCRIDPT